MPYGAILCCTEEFLCASCYARELFVKRGQANVIGQCWAERICRGELRAREAWPAHEGKAAEMARDKVRYLTRDPRMLEELAAACTAGAAAWWQRRPARYRMPAEPQP